MNPFGAPEKFSEERINRILEGVRKGVAIKQVASLGGIHYSTLRKWLRQGEANEDPKKADFYSRYKQAESECVEYCLDVIRTAALKHWQAAAWILERRYPEEYGSRKAAEIPYTNDADEEEEGLWEAYPEEVQPKNKR